MNNDELKKLSAEHAVSYIKSGMVIGLGTGTTSLFALKKISELISSGELKNIIGIPSSIQTENEARKLHIPLGTLNEYPEIDLTIDGADEVAVSYSEEGGVVEQINLIKGGGGALLREKIIAQASKEHIVIIDETKFSEQLGTKWAVPVEVIPFAAESEKLFLNSINAEVTFRNNDTSEYFNTDEGNIILDCNFGKIGDPKKLSILLNCRAGIVDHGLFVNLSSRVIIGSASGIREIF